MDKIIQYRPTQKQTFEDFFNIVTDTGICQYCLGYEECKDVMGEDNILAMTGNGCSAFDNSVDNLKQIYLLEQCTPKGT